MCVIPSALDYKYTSDFVTSGVFRTIGVQSAQIKAKNLVLQFLSSPASQWDRRVLGTKEWY